MNGNKDGRKRRDDRLSEGMILSTPTWKRYRAFLKRCWSFLKTQRPFLKTSRSFCSTQRELYIFKCVRRHASVNTYGGISPHVYTHRATRTYAWAYTYICHCVRLRHILSRDWISLSSLLTKAFLCCIFVVVITTIKLKSKLRNEWEESYLLLHWLRCTSPDVQRVKMRCIVSADGLKVVTRWSKNLYRQVTCRTIIGFWHQNSIRL